MFNNKNILITGGTGSFGKSFVAAILKNYKPNKIIVFSRDELKQYEMAQEYNAPCMRYFIGDVRDRDRLFEAMYGIDFVVHAAAMKQVPASEYNPMECVKTNIHGAENVISAALHNNVEKVIALSTDKAANPINLYGATKLVSDKLFIAANNIKGGRHTAFSIVRYGNVAGSRGSVIPYFQQLVADGKNSLPITDPEMSRFLITLDQGIKFVIRNFEIMQGGETFVPKIPSANIMEIAQAVAPQLKTHIIGIRPGEKLHEVMCPADDAHVTIEFDKYYIIAPVINFAISVDYTCAKDGEKGKYVNRGVEYNSGTNSYFLTAEEIRKLYV